MPRAGLPIIVAVIIPHTRQDFRTLFCPTRVGGFRCRTDGNDCLSAVSSLGIAHQAIN
jgi:hypothetical protein